MRNLPGIYGLLVAALFAATTLTADTASARARHDAPQKAANIGHHAARKVAIQQGDLPELPPLPEPPPNYSGKYDLSYTSLMGDVEVCVTVSVDHYCLPITLNIPLYNGDATVDSLSFILDDLTVALSEQWPSLPEEYYPSYEVLLDYLFPLLVEELNLVLDALPESMDLTQKTGVPIFEAALSLMDYGFRLPGQIVPDTGEFTLMPDVMKGQIYADREFRGNAVYEIPLAIAQSTDVNERSGGKSLFTLSINGMLGSQMNLVLQPVTE